MKFEPLRADLEILGYVSIRLADTDTGDYSELYRGDFDDAPSDICRRICCDPCALFYPISDYINNHPAAALVIELHTEEATQ